MNPVILEELIKKWKAEATQPECEDADDVMGNAIRKGERQGLRKAAEDLEKLVELLEPVKR